MSYQQSLPNSENTRPGIRLWAVKNPNVANKAKIFAICHVTKVNVKIMDFMKARFMDGAL